MNNNIIQIMEDGNTEEQNAETRRIDATIQMIRDAESDMGPGRNIMVLACHWRYFAAEDLEGLQKLGSCINYRMVEIPCSGQVRSSWITTALESGADAVLVMGGHPDTCHFAKCMKCGEMLGEKLNDKGREAPQFDPARLSIDWSEGDRSSRFSGTVEKFISALEDLEVTTK
jgi:F420-non-reducing hydrogenase iron-sulfur subunit